MGRTKVIQHSFAGGILSPTAYGRVDIARYFNSVKDALNVTSHPHGGMFKRNGTKYIDTVSDGVLIKFSFNISQSYILVFQLNKIDIYFEDTKVATVTTTYTAQQCKELGYTQSADTLILTHKSHPPKTLVRGATHALWTLSNITFTNVPTYDFGSGAEPAWSATRGYPSVCTFYEARLWLAGTTQRPQSVFGSVTNDFYNFDLGTSLADEAIFDTLDTDQINPIVNIFPGRQLQVFTEGGEFSNTEKPITPEKSSWTRHTNYGSSELIKPEIIDGATLYMDRTGRNLREFIYSFSEDSFVSQSASTLAYDIINNPVDMTLLRGTSIDISNLIFLVNSDGTMAVFNTLRTEEVASWTRFNTNGQFISIEALYDDLYMLVKRGTAYYLEKMVDGVYLDSYKKYTSTTTTITGLDHLEGYEVQVFADGAVLENRTVSNGQITIERTADELYVGLGYNTVIDMLPLSPNLGGGSSVNKQKRVIKTTIRVYNTLGLKVNGDAIPDRYFGENVLNATPQPFTGIKEIWHLGYDRLLGFTMSNDTPTPFKILMAESEVNTK